MSNPVVLVIGRSMTEQETSLLKEQYGGANLELIEKKIKTVGELQKWKKNLTDQELKAIVVPINFDKIQLQKMIAAMTTPKGQTTPIIYPSYDRRKIFICFMQYQTKLEAVKAV